MSRQTTNPWLHRFALMTAGATLVLIGIGGLVTSHEAGMAVPDWPNSYGYNMFLFPISKWMGGIFYEHSHRLAASAVGLLTTILCLWLWVRETRKIQWTKKGVSSSKSANRVSLKPGQRPAAGGKLLSRIRTSLHWVKETQSVERWIGVGIITAVILLMGVRQLPMFIALASAAPLAIVYSVVQIRREPGSLRWWGIMAFAAVILQGVLGGLRVVLIKDEIGIFHAILAQMFLVLLWAIALFTSQWWQDRTMFSGALAAISRLRQLLLLATALIFAQLVLGATMRQQHAGLAIPDFPLAYGKVWPAMDAQSIIAYNQQRKEMIAVNPITEAQIILQMVHRILAVLIFCAVSASAWTARKQLGSKHPLAKLTFLWVGLLCLQIVLGASTIWSNKAADIATLHVLVGALSLASGSIITTLGYRRMRIQLATANLTAAETVFHPGKPVAAHPN